jgi:hypothetical protein
MKEKRTGRLRTCVTTMFSKSNKKIIGQPYGMRYYFIHITEIKGKA